jgi:hypothetical protein
MTPLYNIVLNHFAENTKLTQLISLVLYLYNLNDIPFPEDKLIGYWDDVKPGRKIKITWNDPYRVETGFLFTLPGLTQDILKGGIVQIPESDDDPTIQRWYTLFHLAMFAETLELEPEL